MPLFIARNARRTRMGNRRTARDPRDHRPGRHLQGHRPGSDASINACSIRDFVQSMTAAGRHSTPPKPPSSKPGTASPKRRSPTNRSSSSRSPSEPLRAVDAYEYRTRQMHGEADYAKMWVSLYEQFVRHGDIMLGAGYPVKVNGRYIMATSPIPRWIFLICTSRKHSTCSAPAAKNGCMPCRRILPSSRWNSRTSVPYRRFQRTVLLSNTLSPRFPGRALFRRRIQKIPRQRQQLPR